MTELTKSIWTRIIGGIELSFEDISMSNTVNFVFGELTNDYYGLNQVNLTPEDVVIDIGANVGMFSIYVKKKFGCKVIAFEPVPMNFEQFKKNIILNGLTLEDIELHDTAITDTEGDIVRIGTPLHNTGGSSIFDYNTNFSMCKTETIDKYITDKCKYLKIDCEGGEYVIIPTIIDKLNQFNYIGIEYHRFINSHNPLDLHNLIVSNFKGQIFGQIPI
jgi:FkbM family methyltransferase